MNNYIDNIVRLAFQTAGDNITESIPLTENALEFLKRHADVTCDLRTEWICYRDRLFGKCKLCPAFIDKNRYELEQAEAADKICIKRNMLMFGDDYKISDDCRREDITVDENGRNCDECPAYDDLIELLGECESAKAKRTALAVENIEIQAAKKIKLIQSQKSLY